MRRKNMTTTALKNKKMNDATYAERRRVMAWIYRARDVLRAAGLDLPRIEVRICEPSARTLGVGRRGAKMMWISESAILGRSDAQLGQTVLHEIAHAAFDAPHVRGCPLMDPYAPSVPNIRACEAVLVALAHRAA